jgi:hypothetical protein
MVADMDMVENATYCAPVSEELILNLQALEIPEVEDFFGNSCTSSASTCCTGLP